jgi:hypothetical protein
MKSKGLILVYVALGALLTNSSFVQARTAVGIEHADSAEEAMKLLWNGRVLRQSEADELERRLELEPGDRAIRTQLVGYYWTNISERRHDLQRQLLWIIENDPDSVVAGTLYARLSPISDGSAFWRARQLWIRHVGSKDASPVVLRNAASFFSIYDTDLALEILERATSEHPEDPELLEQMIQLYVVKASAEGQRGNTRVARNYIVRVESMLDYHDGERRVPLLVSLARLSLMATDFEKSEAYARELLSLSDGCTGNWDCGNAIHKGNIALGQIALARDNLQEAREHLMAAGRTPGSPQLNTFGPDFALARALLLRGETAAVLEYLRLCGEFWVAGLDDLEVWAYQIRKGDVPNFSPK